MKISPERKAAFLAKLADGESITTAARSINITTQTAYQWRKEDPEFATNWEAALESGTDKLEDEATRRALDSSDVLLIFLLKAKRPEKYRERYEVKGTEQLTNEQLESKLAEYCRKVGIAAFTRGEAKTNGNGHSDAAASAG